MDEEEQRLCVRPGDLLLQVPFPGDDLFGVPGHIPRLRLCVAVEHDARGRMIATFMQDGILFKTELVFHLPEDFLCRT